MSSKLYSDLLEEFNSNGFILLKHHEFKRDYGHTDFMDIFHNPDNGLIGVSNSYTYSSEGKPYKVANQASIYYNLLCDKEGDIFQLGFGGTEKTVGYGDGNWVKTGSASCTNGVKMVVDRLAKHGTLLDKWVSTEFFYIPIETFKNHEDEAEVFDFLSSLPDWFRKKISFQEDYKKYEIIDDSMQSRPETQRANLAWNEIFHYINLSKSKSDKDIPHAPKKDRKLYRKWHRLVYLNDSLLSDNDFKKENLSTSSTDGINALYTLGYITDPKVLDRLIHTLESNFSREELLGMANEVSYMGTTPFLNTVKAIIHYGDTDVHEKNKMRAAQWFISKFGNDLTIDTGLTSFTSIIVNRGLSGNKAYKLMQMLTDAKTNWLCPIHILEDRYSDRKPIIERSITDRGEIIRAFKGISDRKYGMGNPEEIMACIEKVILNSLGVEANPSHKRLAI